MTDIVFLARTVSNGLRVSKEKHTPSVCLQFLTIADLSEPPTTGFKPTTMYADLYITEAASAHTIKTLRQALGWKGDSFKELNEPILAGKMVRLVCAPGDRGLLKVKFINRPGAFAPMTDEALECLCADVDRHLQAIKQAEDEPTF